MRIRKTGFRKLISAVVIQLLFIIPLIPPLSANEVENIAIPENYGTVTEKHQGEDGKPVIIHIRDAHCNLEAQQNIAAIISSIVNNRHISLVGLEGAQGEVDVSNFTSFPIAEVKRDVCAAFLATGNLSGSEYALINSETPFSLVGIESAGLYAQNYELFLKSHSKSEQYKSAFITLKDYLRMFLEKICGENKLADLISRNYLYRTKKESLTAYCVYIISLAEEETLDMSGYGNLLTIKKIGELEKSFNLDNVQTQSAEAFDMLAQFIEDDEKNELLNTKIKYQLGQLSNREYYNYLKKIMDEIEADITEYPDLASYIEYLNCANNADFKAISADADKLSELLIEKLAVLTEEKTIAELMRNLAMLELTAELKLTHTDFEYIKKHKPELTDEYFSRKIKELSEKTKNPLTKPLNLTVFDTAIPEFISFYEVSKLRDAALAENLIAQIDKAKVSSAIAVTGGFHTEGMTDYLAKKGFSYIVISPNISQSAKSSYMERMARAKSPFVQALLSSNTLAVESLLQKTGMVLSPQELRAYRNFFNAYLLAYAANNIKDAELFRQNLKVFENNLTSDIIAKLKPVMDLIEQELGQTARQWAQTHFSDLADFEVDKITSDRMVIAMNIMDKRYTIEVSRSDIEDLNIEDTVLKLAHNVNMAVASISEIVSSPAKLQDLDAGIVSSAQNIAGIVKAPMPDNHKKFKVPDFINALSSAPALTKTMSAILADNKISEIWIEENMPAQVIATIFDALNRPAGDPSKLTLSKKMAVLDDFSYGIMITTDLTGNNQLNLYSVPALITKKFARKAELADITPSEEFNKSLAVYFAGLPDGRNGIITSYTETETLMIPQIIDELSAKVKTEFSEKIIAEIRSIFINRDTRAMNNLEKYMHIFQTQYNLRLELTAMFVRSISSILMENSSLSKEDETQFGKVMAYILLNYGYDRGIYIFDFLNGQSADFTNRILSVRQVILGNETIPSAFMGHEIAIGNDVIGDLVYYNYTPGEFAQRMEQILYNSWNSQDDRNILIQNAVIIINNANRPDYLTALYDLLGYQNNKEIVFPKEKKEGDKPQEGAPERSELFANSRPDEVYTILIGDAPVEDKKSALNFLATSRNKDSLNILMKYIDQSVPQNLLTEAVERTVMRVWLGIVNGTLTTQEGLENIDKLMQMYAQSHYLDMKKTILEHFADMIAAPNIPLPVKTVLLMFIESAQTGPDITMRETAKTLLRNKNGYAHIANAARDIFAGKANDDIRLIMDNMGNINRLARKGLNSVDKIDLDTALKIYDSTRQTRILFELESPPTVTQFKQISKLSIEIILLRNRDTGKWYILNGDEYSIDSEILLNQLITGNFDVNIHNHPSERIPTPSGADLKTARLAEHNFIIAEDGLMTYNHPTRAPGKGVGQIDLDEFEKQYNAWADDKTIDQKTLFWMVKTDYGVELTFQKWADLDLNRTIPAPLSLPDLLYDNSPFTQSIGINALRGYTYQDLAGVLNLISAIDEKARTTSYNFISTASQETLTHFFREMEHMLDNLSLRLGIIQTWLTYSAPFIEDTIGNKLGMPQRAQVILDNIENYKTAIESFDLQSFDNLGIIAKTLTGLRDMTADMEKMAFNIELTVNDALGDAAGKPEYAELSAFARNIHAVFNEIAALNEFLNESSAGKPIQNEVERPNNTSTPANGTANQVIAASFASTRKETNTSVKNIIKELASAERTDISASIINELRSGMYLPGKEIGENIFDKYNSVAVQNPELKQKTAYLFAEALADSFADMKLLNNEDKKPFTLIMGGFLDNFGLDYIKPLYTYFYAKAPQFFNEILYGSHIEINNIRVPISFVAHSATLSKNVALEIVSSKLPKDEFLRKISQILYNDAITPKMRSFIFTFVTGELKKTNQGELLNSLYNFVSLRNSQEFELPNARTKTTFSDLAKLALMRINLLISRSATPAKLVELILSSRTVAEKEYAMMLLSESKAPESLDVMQKYVFNKLSPELSTLGFGLLMQKTQKWLKEGKISLQTAQGITEQIINKLHQTRYLEPKQAILNGLGRLASDKDIDWQLRAIALMELESAQLGPDLTVILTAKSVFSDINGYTLMNELSQLVSQGKLNDKLPVLVDKMGTKFRVAEFGLAAADKVDLETALDIYRQNPQPGILFELKNTPSIGDLKKVSELPFEVLIMRERISRKIYIVNGDENSINTQVLAYLSQVGRIDVAIHNHPDIDISHPSDVDIVYGSKNIEHNYVIGKQGMAKFSQATQLPTVLTPIRIKDMDDFINIYDSWASMMGEPDPNAEMTRLLMFRDFGIDYKFNNWDDIKLNEIFPPSNSVNSLIISPLHHYQGMGIDSIAKSAYPNLVSTINILKVIEGSSINSNIPYIRELSGEAVSNFYSQLNNLNNVFNYKFSLINRWLYSYQDYFIDTVAFALNKHDQAVEIIGAIQEFDKVFTNLKAPQLDNLNNANIFLTQLRNTAPVLLRLLNTISSATEKLMDEFSTSNPDEYAKLLEFKNRLANSIGETIFMTDILVPSSVNPPAEPATQPQTVTPQIPDDVLPAEFLPTPDFMPDFIRIPAFASQAQDTFKNHYSTIADFIVKANKMLESADSFDQRISELSLLFYETGVYKAFQDKTVNPFELILFLNLNHSEKMLIQILSTIKDEDKLNDFFKTVNLNPQQKETIHFFMNIITHGVIPAFPSTGGRQVQWQAHIRKDIMLDGKPVLGEITKDGAKQTSEIMRRIDMDAKDIEITVNGKKVFLRAESKILSELGFTGETAVEDFAKFVKAGIDSRGEFLFSGLAEGETLYIGIVDSSPTLFVNHTDDGFIGINKSFFAMLDENYRKPAFLVGLTHELRHEAGVYLNGSLIEDTLTVEKILTEEDIELTKTLFPDMTGFAKSIASIISENEDTEAPDYLRRIKQEIQSAQAPKTAHVSAPNPLGLPEITSELIKPTPTRMRFDIAEEINSIFSAGVPINTQTLDKYAKIANDNPQSTAIIAGFIASAIADNLNIPAQSRARFIKLVSSTIQLAGIGESANLFNSLLSQPVSFLASIADPTHFNGQTAFIYRLEIPTVLLSAVEPLAPKIIEKLFLDENISPRNFYRTLAKVLYAGNINGSARSRIVAGAWQILKTINPDGTPLVKDTNKTQMFYALVSANNNKELLVPNPPQLPKFRRLVRKIISGRIDFANIARNLAPGAIQLILFRTGQAVQGKKLDADQAIGITSMLIAYYNRSGFIDQKKSILEGFAKIAQNESLPSNLRAIALLHIESAQTGADIAARTIASGIFTSINGYALIKSITGKIDSNPAQVIQFMGTPPHIADDILPDIDKVPFELALDTFKSAKTKSTIFEIESAPTFRQLKTLADLNFETQIFHDRETGKYYIINGEQTAVRTALMAIFAQSGRIDISVHNHPADAPENQATQPSAADMASARFNAHNFIITKIGLVEFSPPATKPDTGSEHIYESAQEIEKDRDIWIQKIGEPNATWDNAVKAFGIDIRIHPWAELDENQTFAQFVQLVPDQMYRTEILALGISNFNHMMHQFPKIAELEQTAKSQTGINSQITAKTLVAFYSALNEFQTAAKFKTSTISAWLGDQARYIKEQMSAQFPSTASSVLAKINLARDRLESIHPKTAADMANAKEQIADLLARLTDIHRIMLDILLDINDLTAQIQISDPQQYKAVSEFASAMEKAVSEINNMKKILQYSGIKPQTIIPFTQTGIFGQPNNLSLDTILASANVNLDKVYSDLLNSGPAKTEYPQIEQFKEKISFIGQQLPFDLKLMRIGSILVQTGTADLTRQGIADLFDLAAQAGFSGREQRILSDLKTVRTETEFIPLIQTYALTFSEVKEIMKLFEFTPNGAPAGVSSGIMRFQAYIRPDLKVGGKPVYGKLTKNGVSDIDDIKKEIMKNSVTITIPVAGETVNIRVETEILERLGFTSENRIAEFTLFLRSAMIIRGENLFKGLAGRETIFLGIADTSDTLFVDHKSNSFVGINRAFFELVDAKYLRPAFLVGTTHELRHEAGVYFDGKLVRQPDEIENILTREDTSVSRILIPEIGGYIESLEKLVQVNKDSPADYVAQLKSQTQDEYETSLSDTEIEAAIENAKQEVGGGQFFVVYEKGAPTGKTGKSLQDSIAEIKLKGAQHPVLARLADFLANSVSISSVPSPDGSIGLYRKENRLRLAQPGINLQTGKIDTLYLGKGIVEALANRGEGLNEFLVFEGIKAYIIQKLFDSGNLTIDKLSIELKTAGFANLAQQLTDQAKLNNITKVSETLDLMFGINNTAVNEVLRLKIMNSIIKDAIEFQKIMQTGDINLQSIKEQLIKDEKPQAVTYVLEHLGKSDPSKNYLYVQFKNMERDHQQAIIEMITAKLGKNFDDNIRDLADRSDEIAVAIAGTVRDFIADTVANNLPTVFIIPREFFEATVSQRNWNMEFFMDQFRQNQKNAGRFVVFVAADADPKNPFSLMVHMKIKGVEGSDVDYIHRSENVRQMMDSIKTRFPNSAVKIVDLPGGKISESAQDYSQFNKINIEIIAVEEEQFFYDALQGSVYISGVKTDLGLPQGEADLKAITADFKTYLAEKLSISAEGQVKANDILTAERETCARIIEQFIKSNTDRIDGANINFIGAQLLELQNKLQPDEFVNKVSELKRQTVFDTLMKQYQLLKLQRIYSYFNLADIEQIISVYKKISAEYDSVLAQNGKVTTTLFHPRLDKIVYNSELKNQIKKLNTGKSFPAQLRSIFIGYLDGFINARYNDSHKELLLNYVRKRFDSFEKTANLADTGGFLTTDALNSFIDTAEGIVINPADASYLRQFGDDLLNKAKIIRSASENIIERIEKARALEQSA